MADISMCENQQCPSKEQCYRFKAIPSTYQSYANFTPEKGEDKCEYFEQIYETKENKISTLEDSLEDATEEFENSFINLSIDDITTKGSQEGYVDTYLDNIRSKEVTLKKLTDRLADAKTELKDLQANKKEKLGILQTRLDKLNEGIDISDVIEKK